MFSKLCIMCDAILSEIRETGVYTLWIDNYSKMSRWQIPNLDSGAYKSCLWTGFAVKSWTNILDPSDEIDMTVRQSPSLQRVPAMPEKLFDAWPRFVESYKQMESCSDVYRLQNSFVQNWQVNNVPLKPTPETCNERYRTALAQSTDSMDSLFPEKLIDINVGENEGLVKICRNLLKEHQEQCQRNMSERYLVLNVDCNIFDRMLKVSAPFLDTANGFLA